MMLESIHAFLLPLEMKETTMVKGGHCVIFIHPVRKLPASSTNSTDSNANRSKEVFGYGHTRSPEKPLDRAGPQG
jgi:hypothetical protein